MSSAVGLSELVLITTSFAVFAGSASLVSAWRSASRRAAELRRRGRTPKRVKLDVVWNNNTTQHLDFEPPPGTAADVELGVRQFEAAKKAPRGPRPAHAGGHQ